MFLLHVSSLGACREKWMGKMAFADQRVHNVIFGQIPSMHCAPRAIDTFCTSRANYEEETCEWSRRVIVRPKETLWWCSAQKDRRDCTNHNNE